MAFSKKQIQFLQNANHRWNIKSGATRSGKTFLDYFIIPKRIRRVANEDGLTVILGNTRETVRRNVIIPLQKIWGEEYVSDIRSSDNTAYMFGERVFCIGADKANQAERLRGSSIKYCYGDEVVTWNEEVFHMLKSRLDKSYSKFDGTCNPENPKHWFKKFIDNVDADIYCQNYTIYDNEYLDPEVVKNLENEYRGTVFFDRYILGKWTIAEGLIYPIFSEKSHVSEPPETLRKEVYISMDYGIQNPTAMLLWGKHGDKWYCEDEYYHSGRETNHQKTDDEYYEKMCELATRNGVDDCTLIVDPSAASFIALCRREGRFTVKKAKNDVIQGIQAVNKCLSDGSVQFSAKCKHTIEEFGLYRWDEKSNEDKPIKENDHAMDACRYFIFTKKLHKENRYEPTNGPF